jgi:hypothetical protein
VKTGTYKRITQAEPTENRSGYYIVASSVAYGPTNCKPRVTVLLRSNVLLGYHGHFFFFERPNLFAVCNNTFSKWWEG